MKVADAIKQMSKLPLQRIVDSFTKDFPKPDEDQARDIILRNVEELTDGKRITTVLQFDGPFKDQIRQILMLEAFVNRPDWSASEQEIVESLTRLEQDVLDAAEAEDSLRYEDADRIEILKDVLRTALRDKLITFRELNLLRTLRDSLGLSEAVFRIVLAQLNHFPQRGNVLHTPSECRDVLNALQRGGIVFHCNKADGSPYVIPDEIRASVMDALGLELGLHAWGLLLDALTVSQLKQTLARKKLPTSGTKAELKSRVISSGLSPSRVLGILSTGDLHKLCSSLPGVPVSGDQGAANRANHRLLRQPDHEGGVRGSLSRRAILQVPAGTRPARPREPVGEPDHQEGPRHRARVRGGHPVPLRIKAGPRADGDGRERACGRLHPVRRASEDRWGCADVGQQEHGDRLHVSALPPQAVQALHPRLE